MKKTKPKESPKKILQVQMVLSEVTALRKELRETLRAYSARLEIALAETVNEISAIANGKKVPRERMDQIRGFAPLLGKRKLKPEKGRRKDLRKIEKLISDLHATTYPNASGPASS